MLLERFRLLQDKETFFEHVKYAVAKEKNFDSITIPDQWSRNYGINVVLFSLFLPFFGAGIARSANFLVRSVM